MKLKTTTIRSVAKKSGGVFLFPRLIVFLVLFTLGMILVRVYFSNQVAVSGVRVSIYEQKTAQLTQENSDLQNQISLKTSLGYIDSQAQAMGMVKVTRVELLSGVTPVALNQ